jgi:hypothetical protein
MVCVSAGVERKRAADLHGPNRLSRQHASAPRDETLVRGLESPG